LLSSDNGEIEGEVKAKYLKLQQAEADLVAHDSIQSLGFLLLLR